MSICFECRRGFHDTCFGNCTCNHIPISVDIDIPGSGVSDPEISNSQEEESFEDVSIVPRVRRNKPDGAVKDQQSTGRKRAAKLYPLKRDQPCEWRNTYGKGGGTTKIYGCTDGMQQARHHGPDKNTLNNEPGNVHRICHRDHNSWHAANDLDYDPNKPLKG